MSHVGDEELRQLQEFIEELRGHFIVFDSSRVRDVEYARERLVPDYQKDLVIDMDPFFEKYRSIKPFFITYEPDPPVERFQSQEDRAKIDDSTKCILCGACTGSCPSFWGNKEYVGPAAIVQAHRFIFDSRDQGANERLEILNDRDGVWRCRTVFNCVDACPREIDVTRAIGEVKKLLLFNRMA